ncbi:MAG TPA: hypothetical protein VF789_23225 [Thermoanaerobaculia bacterium]
MLSFAGSVFRVLTLALFAVSLLVGLGLGIYNAGQRFLGTYGYWGEDMAASRRRVMGDGWVETIAALRRAIPRDGEYFLVDGGGLRSGGAYFVRYDLAPRRARYLGPLDDLRDPARVASAMPPGPRWVVLTVPGGEPPVFLDREEFLRQLREEALGPR